MVVEAVRDSVRFYPMRPGTAIFDQPRDWHNDYIFRPKVDGDRVMVDIENGVAKNRHGGPYTKAKLLPWVGLKRFADTYRQNLDTRFLDIEFLAKHQTRKHQAVILDIPNRDIEFMRLMHHLGEDHAIQNGVTCNFSEHIALLPWYDPLDDDVDLVATWENLKKWARTGMKEHKESTPYYEGFVCARKDSMYEKQMISPTKVACHWSKMRFSR
jgi:hypothetical protein